jgi:fused signal recognition particle receptor
MFNFFKKKKEKEIVKEELQEEIIENEVDDSVNENELDEIFKASEDIVNEEVKEEIDEESVQEDIIEEAIEEEIVETKSEEAVKVNTEEKKGFFSRALSKTFDNIKSIVPQKKDKIEFDVIEELLIESDMEYEIIEKAMDGLPDMISRKDLRHRLVMLFEHAPDVDTTNRPTPFVELIIGVNGAGKTTTIAKLANKYKQNNKSVLLGAGDTFRAAAIEQLSTWASKLDIPIIKTKQGHDASAVAYDTISSAVAKNIDHVIIDTAGRLQTQTNLSNELKKIVKVCSKAQENAPHQKLMILDGTQGNTAIAQAQAFNEMIGIDGIIVTKLDGTAKGGALFSISNRLELPIFYIGIGEKQDDLVEFSPNDFVDSLLDNIYEPEEK